MDEINPRDLWRLSNQLEALDKKLDSADKRVESVYRILDGVGESPGLRQQLRELKHAVEGNPPAMRGVVIELRSIHEDHTKLRKDFEEFVDRYNKESAIRQGTWGGAKLLWGLIAGAVVFLGTLVTVLIQIQNALGGRG